MPRGVRAVILAAVLLAMPAFADYMREAREAERNCERRASAMRGLPPRGLCGRLGAAVRQVIAWEWEREQQCGWGVELGDGPLSRRCEVAIREHEAWRDEAAKIRVLMDDMGL